MRLQLLQQVVPAKLLIQLCRKEYFCTQVKRELDNNAMQVNPSENGREDPRYSLTYCLSLQLSSLAYWFLPCDPFLSSFGAKVLCLLSLYSFIDKWLMYVPPGLKLNSARGV